MKVQTGLIALTLMSMPLFAHASCDAVKSDIDARIRAQGVAHYSLDVIDAENAGQHEGKVVGKCERDQVIVYTHERVSVEKREVPTPSPHHADSDPKSEREHSSSSHGG